MNNRHKYFRKLRYKQKLEKKYDNNNQHIYFITKDPNPRELRKLTCFPYSKKHYLNKFRGHDFYISWNRPEIPYSIKTWHTKNNFKTYYKKYSNRIVRKSKNEFQHNSYRKEFDLWWTID